MIGFNDVKVGYIYKLDDRYFQVGSIFDGNVFSVASADTSSVSFDRDFEGDLEYVANNREGAVINLISEKIIEQTVKALGSRKKAIDELWRVIEFGLVKNAFTGPFNFDWSSTPQGDRFWFDVSCGRNPYNNKGGKVHGKIKELYDTAENSQDKAVETMEQAKGFSVDYVSIDSRSDGVHEVLKQRGSRYGDFSEGATIMRGLKLEMHNTKGWGRLSYAQKEALDMIQHKIGRILNGDPNYADNWVDICGYSQLIVDTLNGGGK